LLGAPAAYVVANVPPVDAVVPVVLFSDAYFGWGISLYCMLLGLVVTAAGSALTTPAPEAKVDDYFELSAD
jgi:SSS family solute:Na+ symporter